MSNADLIEVIKTLADSIAKEAADALAAANKRIAELECNDGGGCTLSGPGRGDCEHAVGLPGKSIPGQHDGQDDTVDAYGKPNGWCWSCWKSKRIAELEAGRDNFHMEYRMKCDEETKQLERKLAVARGAKALNLQTPHVRHLPVTFGLDASQPGVLVEGQRA